MKYLKLLYVILIILIISTKCFAIEDSKLPNGNVEVEASRYIHYINKMKSQEEQIKHLQELNNSLKSVIKTQSEEINLHKINVISYQKEISYHELMNKRQEDYIKWSNDRIISYRKEVERLERRPEGFWRRTKDMLFWPVIGLAIGSLSIQLNK